MRLSAVRSILLSGPGDSTSRSRSLTRAPLPLFCLVPRTVLGGSGQLRAMRNCPFSISLDPPHVLPVPQTALLLQTFVASLLQWPIVFTASPTKVFSLHPAPVAQLIGEGLLMGCSPVPNISE